MWRLKEIFRNEFQENKTYINSCRYEFIKNNKANPIKNFKPAYHVDLVLHKKAQLVHRTKKIGLFFKSISFGELVKWVNLRWFTFSEYWINSLMNKLITLPKQSAISYFVYFTCPTFPHVTIIKKPTPAFPPKSKFQNNYFRTWIDSFVSNLDRFSTLVVLQFSCPNKYLLELSGKATLTPVDLRTRG